jgi:hypothetical protein
MLETPHVALGIALAVKSGNPWVAIPLSLASHFLLDRVPHWNPHFYSETVKLGKPKRKSTYFAIADEIVAASLTLYFAYQFLPDYRQSILIMICSLMSVLPDQIKLPYFFMNQRQGILKKWVDFERGIQVEIKPFWGTVTQLVVIIASLFWIFN